MEIPKALITKNLLLAAALILIGVSFRFIPHEANFAPVAAIALLSGATLGWKYALAIPIAILAISDMVIGLYSSFVFTWVAFVVIAMYGTYFRKSGFTKRVLLGGAGSAVIFFVVSNLGVWLASGMYPATITGLIDCFYMALPFFRATLVSDLMYSGVLFGIAAWITQTRVYGYQPAVS